MPAWETLAIVTGALINVGVLVGGLWKLSQIARHVQRTFDYFAREHEMVMQDYAERKGIELGDLPTRIRKAPWWSEETA